ncbi:hypothetical protein TeGR_g7489 [Tetraparma gracilis]|uniref:Uncharacterized protein n=1 Tax=Tetraparma gracilis TaxID=2962635 RepID=A0ABQ6MQP2_9STRA|nr:hypothetical protein TeGR_g7489 [Tetraparma gracilis]
MFRPSLKRGESAKESMASLDDADVAHLMQDKRLARFFANDKSPRKRLRTSLEFVKAATFSEREKFFVGFKDDIYHIVVETVEQYEKLKTDEWHDEDESRVKQGLMHKLGIKKKIGVADWLDLFVVLGELMLHCSVVIAHNAWNNDGVFSLLQKLLHPGNMHPIRVNALELLLRYVQVLSDSHTEGNHLDLMKASVLANLEPLILSESGSMASKGEPYLKSLNVSFWESGPLECLVSEKPLTLDNHLEMLGVLLDYPLKMSADAGRSPQGRNLSVGSAQDANLDFMFWSNTIMASIFPAFFPFVCEQVGFESPAMSKGLRTCPLQIQLVLAKWFANLVEQGGSALDLFWVQGKSGVVIEEMLRQRFERLTSSAAMQPKVELALQTVRMYNSFAEGELQLPKDLQSKKGGACVMFATHVAEILLQAEYLTNSPHYEEMLEGAVCIFESPMNLKLEQGKGEAYQSLILHVMTHVQLKQNPIGVEHSTRLMRLLYKVSAQNSDCSDAGVQKQTMSNLRSWVTTCEKEALSRVVVVEWRQQLLDLTKILIWHIAVGNDGSAEDAKFHDRWSSSATKWLKLDSAADCILVLSRHLNMICPTTLNSLDSKLHYMSVRAVADAVKVWVNEAIVPDRHYKPPPRRGADKEQRNASKERAKQEEIELKSSLLHVSPKTVLTLMGPWLFAACDSKEKEYKEGKACALECLMRLMSTRTYNGLGTEVELSICSRVKEALESMDVNPGLGVVALRRMGELFLAGVSGSTSLIEPFVNCVEAVLKQPARPDRTGGVVLGSQTKSAVLSGLCCVVTLCNKYGDLPSSEKSHVPLREFKSRLGDIFIKFATGITDDSEWLRLCASGLYLLIVEECQLVYAQKAVAEEAVVRHWIFTLAEWCNSTSDNVAFAALECLYDLSQMCGHLGGEELDLHHQLVLNLCGSTWQMLRGMYNDAHVALAKQQEAGALGKSGSSASGGSGSTKSKGEEEHGKMYSRVFHKSEKGVAGGAGEEGEEGTRKGSYPPNAPPIVEFDADTILGSNMKKRIIFSLSVIEAWVMSNPGQFLLHEDTCMKFFDVLEAAVMGKLPTCWEGGGAGAKYQATNRLPRMLLMLRMDQHLEKKGNVMVPVFPDISEAAEGIILHLLNFLNNETKGVDHLDLHMASRLDLWEDGRDESKGEKGSTVFLSYLDSILISMVEKNEDGEAVVVFRDATGAYSWVCGIDVCRQKDVDEKLIQAVLRRRHKNMLYNSSLCEAPGTASMDRTSGGSLVNKGPAWFKNSSSSIGGSFRITKRVNSAGGAGGGSEKSVQFDDGVLEKAKAKEEAETEKSASEKRKDLLLARMHSNPVGGGGVAEIFGDYDLAADNMKDVINEIGITEVDDPTLMGNKYARGKDFEGDQGGGEIRYRPVETVLRVLHDDTVTAMFSKFLKKEFALESYTFWKEVQDFKLQDKAEGRKVSAELLFKGFVEEGSDDQINIPSGMVTEVKERMKKGDFGQDLFDNALEEVVKMLARDKLPRFLKLDEVKDRFNVYDGCVKCSARVDEWAKKQGKVEKDRIVKDRKIGPPLVKVDSKKKNAEYTDRFDVTRLFASQIGLLQPYESSMFKVLNVHDDQKKFNNFVRNIKHLDSKCACREAVKVGVLYVANGQTHQRDILANKRGSAEYEKFVDKLGTTVDLGAHKGFNGKLDDK